MSNLNQVFATVEPYRVLAALAMPISTRNGAGHFTCDGSPYWFDRSKIVALEPGEFVAGDVVDFATWRLGLREGLAWLLSKFSTQLPQQYPADLEALVQQAKRRQQHLRAIVKLSENLTFRPDQYPDANLWLRRQGLDRVALAKTVYASRGKELNALRLFLGLEPKPLPETRTYLVTPYFSDWDQVAALRLESAIGDSGVTWWSLNETAHAWAGLHAVDPTRGEIVVRQDYGLALRNMSRAYEDQSSFQQLQVRWTSSLETARRFESLLISVPDEDARTILQMTRLAEQTKLLRSDNTPVDWQAQLYRQLQLLLQQEGYSFKAQLLVDVLRDDRSICQYVQDRLSVQHPDHAARFRQQVSPMVKVLRGNYVLAETASGYTLAKSGSSQEELITNFRIKVEQNVWFDNSEELWHAGRLLVDHHEFPIKFSRRAAGKGEELEGIAVSVVQKSGKSLTRTPVLFDPSHKKHLAALVSHQIANAERIEGVRQLGWNQAFNRFTTTVWRVGALGVETPPRFQHPANLLLERHFDQQPLTINNTISPDDPLELLAVTIAMLARSSRGVEVLPQAIHSGMAGKLSLERLVAVFGQRLAISPKGNQRAGLRRPFDPDDLNGLPIWLDVDAETADRMVHPAFYLSPTGVDLQSTPSFTGRATWVVQQMLQSMLRQPVVHSMPNAAGWQRLAFEGQQLLMERCAGPWTEIRIEQPAWRRLLWRTGLERLGERFALDGNQIRLSRQDLPRDEQRALQDELLSLAPAVRVEGLDLVLPLNLFNRLVEENLGVRPTIDRLRAADATPRLATV